MLICNHINRNTIIALQSYEQNKTVVYIKQKVKHYFQLNLIFDKIVNEYTK